ncbi:MAG TPA: M1 family metallopeptidase, partial [Gemmatimonadaceae bacterium]|nr:M1 family metallopeptidase [Gemmatimonadaceae bacterium]
MASSLAVRLAARHVPALATLVAVLLGSRCLAAQADIGRGATTDLFVEHFYRPGVDVQDYALSLDLPATGKTIAGCAVLTVRHTTRVDTLVLDLVGLTVDSVRLDRGRVPFSRTPTEIHVPFHPNGKFPVRVEVAYHGPVEDGLIVRTDSAGRWTGFGDNWPNRARYWIPSVDHPSDKATVSWTVTAPAGRTVVANGVLVDRTTLPNGRVRTRWRESHPIAVYLMVIAAAPLTEYPLGQTACGLALGRGCVPQFVYTAPEQRAMLPGAFAQAGEIVRYFSSLVGPFPYEKLAHLQSATRFGGMENATAIFYSDAAFRTGRMGEGLIAHETAHQWFGDAVTERDWSHLWLSEGFATYFAALFARHAHGDSAFRREMAGIRSVVLSDADAVPTHAVIDTVQRDLLALLNANSYQKGGFVLHMLRKQVGDSAFFAALRSYYSNHRDGTALTDDLRAAMEQASGQQLAWFFDQWLRRPGFPELNVTWSSDPSSHQVTLDIVQGSRFGAFRFPLTVELRDAGGVVRRATVLVPAETRSHIVLPPEAQPASPRTLLADPDVELLARIDV